MPADKLYHFEVNCAGGLEDILIDELRQRLGRRLHGLRDERGEVGRVFFRYEGKPRRLLELETASSVMALAMEIHDVSVGAPGLRRISRQLGHLPVQGMMRLSSLCDGSIDPSGYRLRVVQRGAHRFSVAQTEAEARRALEAQALQASPQGMDLELRIQKRRAQLKLALRREAQAGAVETKGLPPAMVAAIVRLLNLDDDDDLLLVNGQAAAAAAAQRATGSRVLCVSRRRPPECGALRAVVAADVCLPVGPGTMTASVQVLESRRREQETAARARLAQATEAVGEGGVVACLVLSSEGFAARLAGWGLPVEILGALPVYVRRRRWALFLLHRTGLLQLG